MCLKTCDLKVWKNLPAKKCIMKLVEQGISIVINTHKNQIVSCLFLDPLIQPDHSCSSIGTLPNLLDDSMEKNPWDDTPPHCCAAKGRVMEASLKSVMNPDES